MGLCVEVLAFKGAPAMAMAPSAGCLVQRCHPAAAAHGMMHSFRYFKGGRVWSTAQRFSSGSWSEVASEGSGVSKRRARGPVMAAAKKAAGEGE